MTIGTTNFLYDGQNVVQELSGGSPTANLLTGGLDEVFQRTDTGGTSRVWSSIRPSNVATSRGSHTVRGLRPAPRAADATGWQHGTFVDFTDPFRDHVAQQTARPTDETHAPIAQCDRFTGRHQATRTFVQQRPHRLEFRRRLGKTVQAQAA